MTASNQIAPTGSRATAAARVLDEVAQRRRLTIRLPDDLPWLEEISAAPRRLISHMHRRGLLHLVGHGRYVVAPAGTRTLEQVAPPELVVDLLLRPHGPYYIGFLSSLIAHRLTDLHSTVTYAAVPQGTRVRLRAPLELEVVQLSPSLWPAEDHDEVERFRVVEGTKEFAHRASIERTLVDGLVRPDLCAGFETVVLAWSRARRRPDVSWERLAEIARRLGAPSSRRAAFLLSELGLDDVAERHLADLPLRGDAVPLDRSNGFGLERDEMEPVRGTGIRLNVPRESLRGWVAAGNAG